LEKFEMKKSLIALAVMAASGASMAQSSVTLYGIADLWFGTATNENNNALGGTAAGKVSPAEPVLGGPISTVSTNPYKAATATAAGTNPAVGSLSQTLLNSGGVNGSRWGMKGSEDLGGGLKANFDFQAGITLDDGAGTSTSATAFSRQSWVGFSGGFGALRLGRTTTPFDDVSGSSNAVFDSALAPANSVFKSTGYSSRQSNMLFYQGPNMGGFSGAISYALGEDKTATTGATSTTSLNLTYGAGPLAVQFAYQNQDVVNAAATSADANFTRLGASYNFGVATAKATYGKAGNISSVNGADATEWQLGVDYPMSSAMTLSASYARSSDNLVAGDVTRSGYGLGAAYTLSKRTFLYGGYESDVATKTGYLDAKHSVFAVGVQHRF
jgi:predicted porin